MLHHDGTKPAELHTATVTIPFSSKTRIPLRMRVRADDAATVSVNPCTDMNQGQTEDYSVIAEPVPTGITSYNTGTYHIYPNPAQDVLAVEGPAPVLVSIYSADGKLLLQQQSAAQISIAALAEGLYLVKITEPATGMLLQYSKILKQQ